MSRIMMELEMRLRKWATWCIAIEKGRVGFPTKSTVAGFWEGSVKARYSRPPIPLNNLQAQEMNEKIRSHMASDFLFMELQLLHRQVGTAIRTACRLLARPFHFIGTDRTSALRAGDGQ